MKRSVPTSECNGTDELEPLIQFPPVYRLSAPVSPPPARPRFDMNALSSKSMPRRLTNLLTILSLLLCAACAAGWVFSYLSPGAAGRQAASVGATPTVTLTETGVASVNGRLGFGTCTRSFPNLNPYPGPLESRGWFTGRNGLLPSGLPGGNAALAFDLHDFGPGAQRQSGWLVCLPYWALFALLVVSFAFNTVLGEELFFRGLLLPRMGGNVPANAALFALYHVHQPWGMLNAFLGGLVGAYATKRWRSAWLGILAHSAQSVFFTVLLFLLVLS